jgi:hypothetical protein
VTVRIRRPEAAINATNQRAERRPETAPN